MLNDLLAKNSSGGSSVYVEDVFSTYLYAGTGAAQTITNGINLSGEGGLVWTKARNLAYLHSLIDTVRGGNNLLFSNATSAQTTYSNVITSFNSTGYSLGTDSAGYNNDPTGTFASWTFRKSAKFFDIVTWTGNATARDISHSLGVSPGLIIIKRTDAVAQWPVWHRSLPANNTLFLNTTDNTQTASGYVTSVSANTFSIGTSGNVNANGGSYVAYLFAHDTTADGVIQCGSFTTDGSGNATVNLGWEPQFILWKNTSTAGSSWQMADNMRGLSLTDTNRLLPNGSNAELSGSLIAPPNSSGFTITGTSASVNWVYLAIRRGPMRVPTDATKVFTPIATSAATGTTLTTGFPVDTQIFSLRSGTTNKGNTYDRLRGVSSTTTESGVRLITNSTAAETTTGNETRLWDNTGFQMPSSFGGSSTMYWNFRRAPGFFDVTCYSGTGSARTVSHNLGVAPELMIVKRRSAAADWSVYVSALGNDKYLSLNDTIASSTTSSYWNSTSPTSSVFSTGVVVQTNGSGSTYVAYLFASCPGVSKVGSYTGTGTTLQINCGFTNGARFVLIKRTDSTGDWYVYDSARGIVAGNDPYLLLNSTAAEVTNTDYVDAYSAGFELSSTAPAALNANGGTYIYLAIA